MKEAADMDWTDGAGKVLAALGGILSKAEKEKHDAAEVYTSNPSLMVIDLETGATALLETEPHEGGRTQGQGYKKEAAYDQRIPMKVPMSLQRNILLDMIVSMLVPKDSEQMGPLGNAAYERIAQALKDGLEHSISTDGDLAKYWKERYANHADLVTQLSEQINDMTLTTVTGKAFCKMSATPLTDVELDIDAIRTLQNIQGVRQDG
tara:strand:- start:1595 stop:2215 length:621 start_codon:yes stop_codon:yes gene_type:complete